MNAPAFPLRTYQKYLGGLLVILGTLLSASQPVSSDAPGERPIDDDCGALLRAVKANDVDEVQRLLATVDPNCTYREDGEPRSPLVAAARNGNLAIGKLLVAARADVGFRASGDETPLMAASAGENLDFVKYLVGQGAEVNEKLAGDGTALIAAARSGRLATVEYLLGQGAEVDGQVNTDGTPLINAVRNGHQAVAEVLLTHGADPYLVLPGDEYAMHHAVIAKDQAMIDLLRQYSPKE